MQPTIGSNLHFKYSGNKLLRFLRFIVQYCNISCVVQRYVLQSPFSFLMERVLTEAVPDTAAIAKMLSQMQ